MIAATTAIDTPPDLTMRGGGGATISSSGAGAATRATVEARGADLRCGAWTGPGAALARGAEGAVDTFGGAGIAGEADGSPACTGAIPGIATPSIVPLGIGAWDTAGGLAETEAAAVGGTNAAPPSIVFWKPGLPPAAGACDGVAAGGEDAVAGGWADSGDANPSIVFIGSFAAAGAATGAGASGATGGARGVGSAGPTLGATPGGSKPGENPSMVLRGSFALVAGTLVLAGPVPDAAGGVAGGCMTIVCNGFTGCTPVEGAGAAGSLTAPHWPQNFVPSGIGCPH
jgi:hypothetical protein